MLLYFLLLGGAVPPAVLAQGAKTTSAPCTQAEAHQFDFWVGEWNASWPAGGGQPAGQGRNSITRVLDGCVVEENFSGEKSMPLRGLSVSTFNARLGKWQQTWVDNQGGYLDFVGGWNGKEMILSREATTPKGDKIWQRMVWKNITPKGFDWSWESSKNGKDWQVMWPIKYERSNR
jgi:hypothetical protein